MQKLPHFPSLTQGQNTLDGSSPHNALSRGVLSRPATTSQHVSGSSPELLQWKANLETWAIQPSSQERLPKDGRGLPGLVLRTGYTKKATELAEPEINKSAFGQEEAVKDMMIHSPLLSIICLGTLIFGIFLKPSLFAHTNLDDEPAERCWNRNQDEQGMFSPSVLPHCLTLSFSHPAVLAKTVHLQIKLVVIHLPDRAKILDDNQCGKKPFFFFFFHKKINHMKHEENKF